MAFFVLKEMITIKIETIIKRLEKRGFDDPTDANDYLVALKTLEQEHLTKDQVFYPESHKKNKQLKIECLKRINDKKVNAEIRVRYLDLYKKALKFDSLIDFDSYLLYLEFEREPHERFYQPRRNIFLKHGVIQAFQDLEDDTLDILTLSLPPGVGKSTLGIMFLSWIMGKYPNDCNLASAHSDKLTRSFYDGALTVINDPDYLWHDIFDDVVLQGTNSKDETINLNKPNRFKTLTCRSIDGSLTGATRCSRYLYADDLVSGIEEAMSKQRMDSLWSKYGNDLKSRKKQKCKEIHIATRWSIYDPIGRLQLIHENNPKARFINIPALDKYGKSNFEYDYGVGFDTAYFEDMKETMDDASFRALYMGEPVEREGQLYKIEELKRYYELPNAEPDAILCLSDTANSGTDYTCMLIGYKYADDIYIHDVVYDNAPPTYVKPQLVNAILRNDTQQGQFESNNAGGNICDDVQKEVKERGGRCKLTKKYTTTNKETRIITNSDFVKSNFYFRDKSTYKNGDQYAKFITDICSYTMAGRNPHDDGVDALAMFALYINKSNYYKPEIFKRPI